MTKSCSHADTLSMFMSGKKRGTHTPFCLKPYIFFVTYKSHAMPQRTRPHGGVPPGVHEKAARHNQKESLAEAKNERGADGP